MTGSGQHDLSGIGNHRRRHRRRLVDDTLGVEPAVFRQAPSVLPAQSAARSSGRKPTFTKRTIRASVDHPIVAGAMGLLVAIVGPALLVLMAFTVILIPVTLIGLLFTGLVVLYAWIGLGAALGQWLRDRLNQDWSPPLSASLGAFLFMVVTDLLVFIPFVGGWIGILATVVGVGAVFLTRFGLREFVPSYDFGPPRESFD